MDIITKDTTVDAMTTKRKKKKTMIVIVVLVSKGRTDQTISPITISISTNPIPTHSASTNTFIQQYLISSNSWSTSRTSPTTGFHIVATGPSNRTITTNKREMMSTVKIRTEEKETWIKLMDILDLQGNTNIRKITMRIDWSLSIPTFIITVGIINN